MNNITEDNSAVAVLLKRSEATDALFGGDDLRLRPEGCEILHRMDCLLKTLLCFILLFCGGLYGSAAVQPFQEDDWFFGIAGADMENIFLGGHLSEATEDFLSGFPTHVADDDDVFTHKGLGVGGSFSCIDGGSAPGDGTTSFGTRLPNYKEPVLQKIARFLYKRSDVDVTEDEIRCAHNWPKNINVLQYVNILNYEKKEHIVYNRENKTYRRYSTPPSARPQRHVILSLCETLNDRKRYSLEEALNILAHKGYAYEFSIWDITLYNDILWVLGCMSADVVTSLKHDVLEKRKRLFATMQTQTAYEQQRYSNDLFREKYINMRECMMLDQMLQFARGGMVKELQECFEKCEGASVTKPRARQLMLKYAKDNPGCAKRVFLQKCLAEGWVSSEITFWTELNLLSCGSPDGRVVYDPKRKVFSWDACEKTVKSNKKLLCAIYDLKAENPDCSRNELRFMLEADGLDASNAQRIGQMVMVLNLIGFVPDSATRRPNCRNLRLRILDLCVSDRQLNNQDYYTRVLEQKVGKNDMEVIELACTYLKSGCLREVWKRYVLRMDAARKKDLSCKRGASVSLGPNFFDAPNLYKFLSGSDDLLLSDSAENFQKKKQRLV